LAPRWRDFGRDIGKNPLNRLVEVKSGSAGLRRRRSHDFDVEWLLSQDFVNMPPR